jgi:GNAT acetyltransferase
VDPDIDAFWAGFFGCSVHALRRPGVRVVPHCGLLRYQGAWAFRYADACILSVPLPLVERVEAAVAGRAADDVYRVGALTALFGDAVDRIIGPTVIAYTDPVSFRPVTAPGTRLLELAEIGALGELAAACGDEWEDGDIDPLRLPIAGRFEGGVLLAAASYAVWGDQLAPVGVVVDPRRRAAGHGRAVASVVCAHALAHGLVPQWRTLEANLASRAVAKALGFELRAAYFAVRLSHL